MTYKWSFLIGFCAIAFSCNTNSPYRQQGYNQPGYNPNQPGYNNQNNNNQNTPQASQGNNNQNTPSSNLPDPRDDDYYDNRDNRDNSRSSDSRRNTDACEDQRSSHECFERCEEMYPRSDDEDECLELDVDDIDAIYSVYEALDTASSRSFKSISAEDFNAFLDVSISGLDSIIRDYDRGNKAQEFIEWLAIDDEIADIMYDEDDDFRRLGSLLRFVSRSSNLETPLISRDNFIELAVFEGNTPALDYFLDYILEKHTSCGTSEANRYRIDCLNVICKIGKSVRPGYRRSFIDDSDVLTEFLEEIISRGINSGASAPDWKKGPLDAEINDIDDLDDKWTGAYSATSKGLCG